MPRTEFYFDRFRITHTVSTNSAAPYIAVPQHYENGFFISFMIDGCGTCTVEGTDYSLQPGTAIAIAADEMHYFKINQEGCHERMTFYFSNALVLDVFGYDVASCRHFTRCLMPGDYDPSILDAAKDILYQTVEGKEALLEKQFRRLLKVVHRTKGPVQDATNLQVEDETIRAICKYIDEHLSEDLSYDKLQKLFFVSRYHLGAKFRQQTGKNLTEYVILKRLMRACALVRSGLGIEDASFQSGFNTYSHFYKEFVKHFAASPKAYFGKKHPSA